MSSAEEDVRSSARHAGSDLGARPGAEAMQCVGAVDDLRRHLSLLRRSGRTVGFVPTMGSLHDGHRLLLRHARAENDIAVLSIFVNPTQFEDRDDFAKYPRDLERDLQMARDEGIDFVFAPRAVEMYPPGFATAVHVAGLADSLEGASRPGHFDGVATVVAKLLAIVLPTRAYFGAKDYQQLLIVRRMTVDLGLPTDIVAFGTVREPDGLAMSSRNARLSLAERAAATVLDAALCEAAAASRSGVDVADIGRQLAARIAAEPLAELDYAVVVGAETLRPVANLEDPAIALVAARFGAVRLIDNAFLGKMPPEPA